MPSGARDHGGIVGVQAGARDRDAGEPRQPLRGATRERLTAGDAAAQHRGVTARGAHRALQLRDQHVEHGVLKGAREMRPVAVQVVAGAHGVEHRRLQSRE